MNFFRMMNREIYEYESDVELYALKIQMREKFVELEKAQVELPFIRGKFTNLNEFEITPIGEIAITRRPGGPLPFVYMKGELIPNGLKTAIVVQIAPYNIWFLMFCSIGMGLFGLYRFIVEPRLVFLLVSIILALVVPALYRYIMARQKQRLKANFVRVFGFEYKKSFDEIEAEAIS